MFLSPVLKMKTPIAKLRKQCDDLYQKIGRLLYSYCLVCGGQMSCLHHYHPKSTSSALRYDFDNGVPICQGCHFRLHNGDPLIPEKILAVKGPDWAAKLAEKRKEKITTTIGYYRTKKEELEQKISTT